jgi:uncharacterized protein YbjT (DUF2867 family)
MTSGTDMRSASTDRPGRSALVVGATGLVGRELVRHLIGEPGFARLVLLARRLPDGPSSQRVETVVTDFDRLEASGGAFAATHVFCALGTTIKQAGSRERFREVDYGYPLRVAQLARDAGARHYLLVSALGADPRSRVFYNRVKGELEAAITRVGFSSVTIARPSLLLGDRAEPRFGEEVGKRLAWLVPRRYKPIPAGAVAAALVAAALADRPGVHVIENRDLPAFARASA